MNFEKPTEHTIVMERLDRVIKELEELKDDTYWAYTKEYWLGLLESSLILLKKIKEDLR